MENHHYSVIEPQWGDDSCYCYISSVINTTVQLEVPGRTHHLLSLWLTKAACPATLRCPVFQNDNEEWTRGVRFPEEFYRIRQTGSLLLQHDIVTSKILSHLLESTTQDSEEGEGLGEMENYSTTGFSAERRVSDTDGGLIEGRNRSAYSRISQVRLLGDDLQQRWNFAYDWISVKG